LPSAKRIVSREPICSPIATDRGDYYYERVRYGDGSQKVYQRRVGSKVAIAVGVLDVGEPILPTVRMVGRWPDYESGMMQPILHVTHPPVDFDVGLPEIEDTAYDLEA
jgi:hypothetical protein